MWEREKVERAAAEAERVAKEEERAAKAAEKEAARVAKMSPKRRRQYELQKVRKAKVAAIAIEADASIGDAITIVAILARRLSVSSDALIDKIEAA